MSDFSFLNYGPFIQAPIQRSKQSMNQSIDERAGRMESDISYIKRDISDIKGDIKELRGDMKDFRSELKDIRKDMRDDFRLIFKVMTWGALGLGGLLLGLTGVMARGFGWL